MFRLAFACALVCVCSSSFAGPDYKAVRISALTFETDRVLIMLDSGIPQNCQGTAYGWLSLRGSYKAIQGSVLGLRMRDDLKQIGVTVYTAGVDTSGYYQVTQVAPNSL